MNAVSMTETFATIAPETPFVEPDLLAPPNPDWSVDEMSEYAKRQHEQVRVIEEDPGYPRLLSWSRSSRWHARLWGMAPGGRI